MRRKRNRSGLRKTLRGRSAALHSPPQHPPPLGELRPDILLAPPLLPPPPPARAAPGPPTLRAGGAPRGGAGVGDPDRDGGAPAEGGRGGDARGPALLFIHPPSAPNIPAPNHLQEDGHSEDAAGEDDALAGWQTVEPEAAASAFCRRRSCKKRGRRHRDKRKLTAVTTYVAIKVFSEESKDSVLDKLRHHGIRACDVLRRPQLWIIVVTFVDGEGPTTIDDLTSEIDKTDWEFKVPVTKHVSCHVLTYCSHHDVIVAKSRNA